MRKFLVRGKQIAVERKHGILYYVDEFGNFSEIHSTELKECTNGQNIISINSGNFDDTEFHLPTDIILYHDIVGAQKVYNELKAIFWIQ